MKAYLCLFTVLGVAVFAAFGVGADFSQTQDVNRHGEALDAQMKATFAREAAHRQIAEDVIADKLTLAEAADKFGELDANSAETTKSVRLSLGADSDRERLARQVLLHVQAALEGKTSEAETILPRLEKEMHEYVSEHVPGV